MPLERVDFDKQDVVECDDRGRATLGTEFADEQVYVRVSELPDPDKLEEPDPERERVAGKLAGWAVGNDIPVMDIDEQRGAVQDKEGQWHDAPFSIDNPPNSDKPHTGRVYRIRWGEGNRVEGGPLLQTQIGPNTVIHLGGDPTGPEDAVQVTPDDASALDGSKGFSEQLPVDNSEYPVEFDRDGYESFTVDVINDE